MNESVEVDIAVAGPVPAARRTRRSTAALRSVPTSPDTETTSDSTGSSPAAPAAETAKLPRIAHSGPVPDERLIDMRTLAEWLGVGESTVRKWVARGPESGLIPLYIRLNGQIRFRPADVRAYLTSKEER